MRKGARLRQVMAENPDVPASVWLQNEGEFLGAIVDCAQANGWMVHHVLDTTVHAKVIGPGFPDLVMVRPPRIVIAELKRQDAPEELPPEQAEWLTELEQCAQASYGLRGNPWWERYPPEWDVPSVANLSLTVCLWRPADWPDIERILE